MPFRRFVVHLGTKGQDVDACEMNAIREETVISEPPFPESAQLCDDLEFVSKELSLRVRHPQLYRGPRLPGQPQVELYDHAKVLSHCISDVCTPKFDKLLSGTSTIRSWNERLQSLSEYGVLDSKITVAENPELHCVWDNDRIFFKPIPLYLTSYAFWLYILASPSEDAKILLASSIGLLRSYAKLIRHYSDFALAQRHHLLPLDWDFESLVLFLDQFSAMPDAAVSRRFTIGAIQLQTLNAVTFLRHGSMYYRIHRNRYNAYFNRYYGPILFVFASFSVALSAMQVAIAVRQAEAPIEEANNLPEAGYGGGLGASWRHMGYAFRWFSLWSICFAASMSVVLFVMFAGLAWMDSWETLKWRREERKAKQRAQS